jgi:hypothetical protein
VGGHITVHKAAVCNSRRNEKHKGRGKAVLLCIKLRSAGNDQPCMACGYLSTIQEHARLEGSKSGNRRVSDAQLGKSSVYSVCTLATCLPSES